MKYCKNCGTEIDERQFLNYNKLCSQCVRSITVTSGNDNKEVNNPSCHFCYNPATISCYKCYRPICGVHTSTAPGSSGQIHLPCLNCAKKDKSKKKAFYIILCTISLVGPLFLLFI